MAAASAGPYVGHLQENETVWGKCIDIADALVDTISIVVALNCHSG